MTSLGFHNIVVVLFPHVALVELLLLYERPHAVAFPLKVLARVAKIPAETATTVSVADAATATPTWVVRDEVAMAATALATMPVAAAEAPAAVDDAAVVPAATDVVAV